MKKRVFDFVEGDCNNRKLLGGKGAGLCQMAQMKLPVPPGFTITTEVCQEYYENEKRLPKGLMDEVRQHMKNIEHKTGKIFGSQENPLLVSVRSGSALSMPGMMDTILNLGLNDSTISSLIKATGNERFAYDAYRRLIQLFCKIALKVDSELFDQTLDVLKKKYNAVYDTDLSVQALKELVAAFKQICHKEKSCSFPEDPYEQLELAIKAVFESWMGKRAVDYRFIHNITPDMASGTAVNVQAMVFGNMGIDSATGVAFTRDPATGENLFYGEYLTNAQGEDVVSGARTPKPILRMKEEFSEIYDELLKVREILEKQYKEVQDFEFTIENKKLYMLQTRDAKMNAIATVKTSLDLYIEGVISKEHALYRIKPELLEQLLHKKINPNTKAEVLVRGISASPGAASGLAIFDADEAARLGNMGKKIILVREETKPDDVHAFAVAQGILTVRGGKTSHAAVVARSMGKPCVSGCEEIRIDPKARLFKVADVTVREGDIISIDGTAGQVYLGEVEMVSPELTCELEEILNIADEIRKLGIRANADTPEAAIKARKFGAQGIGLCRTERMFNAPERLPIMQELVLAETFEERQKALSQLLPMQKDDFIEIFQAMDRLPVTIRLLDPPLHEFLPSVETLLNEIAEMKQKDTNPREITAKEKQLRITRSLYEVNPMLGHRGVRIAITYPEIYEMQIRAIFEAQAEAVKKGIKVLTEIMVPQVSTSEELNWVFNIVKRVQSEVEAKCGTSLQFKFGTMIEVVRGCVIAEKIAEIADFFSFGTNDLTQATFSFSREDAENKFLPIYNEKKILRDNPFEILDVDGVGKLMAMAVESGRKTRKDLKIGICGEHGGEPKSIEFCHSIGLDYVSCSPFRIPIARLAAAAARIKAKKNSFKQ